MSPRPTSAVDTASVSSVVPSAAAASRPARVQAAAMLVAMADRKMRPTSCPVRGRGRVHAGRRVGSANVCDGGGGHGRQDDEARILLSGVVMWGAPHRNRTACTAHHSRRRRVRFAVVQRPPCAHPAPPAHLHLAHRVRHRRPSADHRLVHRAAQVEELRGGAGAAGRAGRAVAEHGRLGGGVHELCARDAVALLPPTPHPAPQPTTPLPPSPALHSGSMKGRYSGSLNTTAQKAMSAGCGRAGRARQAGGEVRRGDQLRQPASLASAAAHSRCRPRC